MCARYQLSRRRSCRLLRTNPSTFYYRATRSAANEALSERIKAIAAVRVHYGYRRITVLLRREGCTVNAKRVYRLYRGAELGLRRRRPRRRKAAVARGPRVVATRPNQVWSMDFVHDRLADGRSLRFLTVVDTHTRECVALEVQQRFRSADVASVLRRVTAERGRPETICCDNGTEFCAMDVDQWAYWNGVKLDYSRPGKPTDNALIESFNARLRQELLNASYFVSLSDAQTAAARWRQEYNTEHPHSSLGHRSPQSYAAAWIAETENRLSTAPA